MYEKIVNYFETNLCIENIYFRKYHKIWIFGIIGALIIEFTINYILSILIENLWTRSGIIIVDFTITIIMLILIYVFPLIKIYRKQVTSKTKIDWIGSLMKEENLSAYREIEIKNMEQF